MLPKTKTKPASVEQGQADSTFLILTTKSQLIIRNIKQRVVGISPIKPQL